MPAGRPRLYSSPEEMQEKLNDYYADCELREAPLTIPGMAYFLGFEDRHSISEYANFPEFTATIKKARMKVEQQRVENLVSGKGSTPGQIFDLKNNFDYKDKQETEFSGAIDLTGKSDAELAAIINKG